MLPALQGFDPLYYFDVDVKGMNEHEVTQIRQKMTEKLSEYILFKLSSQLTEAQQLAVFQIENGEELLTVLSKYIPDLEEKIMLEIEGFKKAYQKKN
jgi:hypothetical protein